jgi:cytochrome c biogenesis protein CcmG/thiol:disulfide interchange protein DsbE
MHETVTVSHAPNDQQAQDIVTPKFRPGRIMTFALTLGLLGVLGGKLVTNQVCPLEAGVAPDFSLTGYDGRTFTLSEHRGHVVIINFWASWCLACREEAAYLEETWRKYADEGVIFVGVAYLDTEDKALAYLEEFDITYINGLDVKSDISETYRIQGVPETFYIGRQGELQGIHVGPLEPPVLDDKIEELLAEPYSKE